MTLDILLYNYTEFALKLSSDDGLQWSWIDIYFYV